MFFFFFSHNPNYKKGGGAFFLKCWGFEATGAACYKVILRVFCPKLEGNCNARHFESSFHSLGPACVRRASAFALSLQINEQLQ